MDRNRIKGTEHEVKGATRELVGKLTGNKEKEIAGNVDKNMGTLQDAVGNAVDKAQGMDRRPG